MASGGNTALVLGGVATSMTSPETRDIAEDTLMPGLIEFEMTTRKFTNSSAKAFTANETGQLGQMHFVPSFGPNGLFLAMGGFTVTTRGRNGTEHFGFDNIWVYEAATHQWYNQTATGNIPEPRREFCVAGLNSTDNTYDIFIYGGNNGHLGPDAVPFDEIFILTLPAFHWLKIDYPPQHPRAGHTCNAAGSSSQVISVSGFDPNPEIFIGSFDDVRRSTFNPSPDPFAQGLGVYDMTTLTWRDRYTANAPLYRPSEMVRAFYRDNPQDGSQFSTEGLKDLFQIIAPPTASDSDPAATSTPSAWLS